MAAPINDQEVDATPLYNNAEELGKVLYALTQPNNDDLKRATLLIRKFLDKAEAIMPLVQQIETSQHAEVRQVAAVYLREQVNTKFILFFIFLNLMMMLILFLLDLINLDRRVLYQNTKRSQTKIKTIFNYQISISK